LVTKIKKAKCLRSTKVTSTTALPKPKDPNLEPLLAPPSHDVFVMLVERDQVMKSYPDQTGCCPIPSSRRNHYIFVLCHQDTNTIHAVVIPNCQAASIRKAWEATHKNLMQQGHVPNLHILNNKWSQELKDAFTKHKIAFQQAPAKEHRANIAERAIRTFKNHFISILCSVDSNFPMTEWDRLIRHHLLMLHSLATAISIEH
jgi:hypothetical protein